MVDGNLALAIGAGLVALFGVLGSSLAETVNSARFDLAVSEDAEERRAILARLERHADRWGAWGAFLMYAGGLIALAGLGGWASEHLL